MNRSRFDGLLRELKIQERKTYDALSFNTATTSGELIKYMATSGINMSRQVADRMLKGLVDIGLVKEVAPGRFVKKPAPSAGTANGDHALQANSQSQVDAQPEANDKVQSMSKDPLQTFAELSAALKQNVARLVEVREQIEERVLWVQGVTGEIAKICAGFEEAALAAEERYAKDGADTEKLRQLQTLLKSIAS